MICSLNFEVKVRCHIGLWKTEEGSRSKSRPSKIAKGGVASGCDSASYAKTIKMGQPAPLVDHFRLLLQTLSLSAKRLQLLEVIF